uniref:Uncharacterized protein n=1 Tax=Pseudonaja textilis TaxID=8673 RepID=A0A670YM26_PSETE
MQKLTSWLPWRLGSLVPSSQTATLAAGLTISPHDLRFASKAKHQRGFPPPLDILNILIGLPQEEKARDGGNVCPGLPPPKLCKVTPSLEEQRSLNCCASAVLLTGAAAEGIF